LVAKDQVLTLIFHAMLIVSPKLSHKFTSQLTIKDHPVNIVFQAIITESLKSSHNFTSQLLDISHHTNKESHNSNLASVSAHFRTFHKASQNKSFVSHVPFA